MTFKWTPGVKGLKESKTTIIWVKVFKIGLSKICGRQPLKNFAWTIVEYLEPFAAQCISISISACFM